MHYVYIKKIYFKKQRMCPIKQVKRNINVSNLIYCSSLCETNSRETHTEGQGDKLGKKERNDIQILHVKMYFVCQQVCCVLVLYYQVNMQNMVEFNTGDFKLANFSVIV